MKPQQLLLLALLALTLASPASLWADAPGRVQIKVAKDRDQITFWVGDELVTRYHIGPKVAKPYFFPVAAPGGVLLTRAWPMEAAKPGESTDHPHQKSAWFCHGDVIPEGIELKAKLKGVEGVDFWSEAKGHGQIVCTEVSAPKQVDKDCARITTQNEWRTADGMKVLHETRILTLYNLGKARLLVLDIDLLADAAPITFGDTKEGSMGVRVNDALREQKGKGKLQNAEGKVHESEVWGQKSAWCDYSGDIDGKTVGIAIFDDPKNPYAACWHSRGYGLMAANPFGRDKARFPGVRGNSELVRLAKGQHLNLRYGILLHTGDATTGNVAQDYQRFVKLRGERE